MLFHLFTAQTVCAITLKPERSKKDTKISCRLKKKKLTDQVIINGKLSMHRGVEQAPLESALTVQSSRDELQEVRFFLSL